MNGYELAAAIRASAECAGIVLVAITGWGASRDVERSGAAGFDHHITKPSRVGEVEELLARVP
jgi:CheY-like chemotaxis protein